MNTEKNDYAGKPETGNSEESCRDTSQETPKDVSKDIKNASESLQNLIGVLLDRCLSSSPGDEAALLQMPSREATALLNYLNSPLDTTALRWGIALGSAVNALGFCAALEDLLRLPQTLRASPKIRGTSKTVELLQPEFCHPVESSEENPDAVLGSLSPEAAALMKRLGLDPSMFAESLRTAFTASSPEDTSEATKTQEETDSE